MKEPNIKVQIPRSLIRKRIHANEHGRKLPNVSVSLGIAQTKLNPLAIMKNAYSRNI